MDSTYVIQAKKAKIVDEALTDSAKCDSQDQQTLSPLQSAEERENLNGESTLHAPETPGVKNVSGSPVCVAAEQNSSGFGDEIGPDDVKSTDSDEGGEIPSIFQTDNLTFDERVNAYGKIFLAKSEFDDGGYDIHQEMYWFLTEAVLSYWGGLWKFDSNCDVVVEVDHAPHPSSKQRHLKAKVHLSEPFQCIVDGEPYTQEGSDVEGKIRETLEQSEGLVDLTDLYPIFNRSGLLDSTALAIEHARFFYQNLWRPMDDEDEPDGSTYMDKYIKPRLKFIYDVKEKRIPAHIVRMHQRLLSECLDKYERISALQGQLGDSDASNSDDNEELDMNQSCMAVDIISLTEELEVQKIKLERLENPVLRSLMDIPTGMLSERRSMGSQSRDDSSIKTFLVTETLTAGMTQNLSPDVVIEHCRSPGEALARCYNGDTILIFPGSYTGERFYSLQQSVTIKGVGEREDIVIRCEELADIFLDCDAPSASISNLTLEDENRATMEGLVAVRAGSCLTMDGCVVRCGGTGVHVFRGGTLKMTACEIKNIKRNGVRCKAGSSVTISDTDIHHCGWDQDEEDEEDGDVKDVGADENITRDQLMAGISVEMEENDEEGDKTTLTITDTNLHDNQGAGIVFHVSSNRVEEPEPITTDVIGLLSGIDVKEMKNNHFSDNEFGDAMLSRFVDS